MKKKFSDMIVEAYCFADVITTSISGSAWEIVEEFDEFGYPNND